MEKKIYSHFREDFGMICFAFFSEIIHQNLFHIILMIRFCFQWFHREVLICSCMAASEMQDFFSRSENAIIIHCLRIFAYFI